MSLMPWRSSLSVHVPQIDAQHKELIRLLNELDREMGAGAGRIQLGRILNRLIRRTQKHFADEAHLTADGSAERRREHEAEDERLMHIALDIQRRFKSGILSINAQVTDFLKQWLQRHIRRHDAAARARRAGAGAHA